MSAFSIYNMALAYRDRNNETEKYDDPNGNQDGNQDLKISGKVMGLTLGLFILLFIFVIVIWIWAVVVLVKYWKQLPDWAKILGILGVLPVVPLGPIVTLIVVYTGKQDSPTGNTK